MVRALRKLPLGERWVQTCMAPLVLQPWPRAPGSNSVGVIRLRQAGPKALVDQFDALHFGQILARSGIEIHRNTLADRVGTVAVHLGPLGDRLAEHLTTSTKLVMDETTAPVLDPRARQDQDGISVGARP